MRATRFPEQERLRGTGDASPFRRRAGDVVLAAIVVLDLLLVAAAARPPRISFVLDPATIQLESGRAWVVDLAAVDALAPPGSTVRSDSARAPVSSSLSLFAGDVALGPPHAVHADIREQGGGRFSHWAGTLYFSTQDGSDPRRDGRVYRVETTAIPSSSAVVLLVMANLIAFGGWARRRPRRADALAALTCAGIVSIATILRLDLTSCLGHPYWFNDSDGYVSAAVLPETLPWSQMRTLGVPALVRLALRTHGSPAGVLLVHHVLWLVGTVAILAVLLFRFRLRLLAVVLAVYLGFSFKDLQFEYSMLSEHAARCVNLLFCAVALAVLGRRPRLVHGIVPGLVVIAAILVRPNAIPLAAVAAGVLLWPPVVAPPLFAPRWSRVATVLALGATVSAGLGVNVFAYHERFGAWRINEFDGYVLFCGFGHLTPPESASEPELAARLRPLLDAYRVKYVSRGEYLCNWLVFGSATDSIRRDLGPVAPAEIIIDHVRSKGLSGAEAQSERNRLMRVLATDGILADPYGYAKTAATFVGDLLVSGPDSRYGDTLTVGSRAQWIQSRRDWDAFVAPKDEAGASPDADSEDRCLLRSAESPPPGRHVAARGIGLAIASRISEALAEAARAWLLLLALVAVPAWRRGNGVSAVAVVFLPAAVVVTNLGWTVLLGVSDPSRFFAPVQDLYVLSWLALPFAAAALVKPARVGARL